MEWREKEKKLVICDRCDGKGEKTRRIRVSTNNSKYKTETCTRCQGSGRIIEQKRYKPYKAN